MQTGQNHTITEQEDFRMAKIIAKKRIMMENK